MDKIIFYTLTDWSIPPTKEEIKIEETNDAQIRWFTKKRVKGACWPYKLAHELGWVIRSPIDVTIEPVEEVQVSVDDPQESFNIY